MVSEAIPYKKDMRTHHNAKRVMYAVNENNCYICVSHKKDECGYPCMNVSGKVVRVHRWVYTQEYGEIKEGNVILHSCDNPSCINPTHLSQGTQRDNVLDMHNKDRHYKALGSKHGRAVLTEKDVYEIKHLLRHTSFRHREIADIYDIESSAISRIKNEIQWKHVKI